MYRLFLKIFFWYWLTAWGMIAIVLLGSRLTGMRQVSAPNMYETVAPILASEAVKAYESGGPEAFARFSQGNGHGNERQLFLLDGSYKDVLSRPLSDDGLRVAQSAKNGQLVVFRAHIAAYKFVSSSGHPYVLMLYLPSDLRRIAEILWGEGLPFSISLIVLVTLLCLGLAYHIASPIHSIQSTARRVAQGDLKARVPSSVSRRHDEVAALAKDFDSMVSRLDSLIQTQKKLLNSVSHELRSPLARINLSLAVLRNEREDVDFAQLVEEVAADANFEAQAPGKSVSFQTTGSIILRNADPHALRSACENIIRNAVRFTRPGSDVQIVLEVDRSAPEPLALLSVRDHGPGVPEDSLQRIFQPFYRISGDGEATGGNGLGLAIASEAIRLHCGTIRAENLQPTGLEIVVQLPAAQDIGAQGDEISKPEHSPAL